MPKFIMPDGAALSVRRFGQGQPIMLLSGLGMHSWQWLPIIAPYRKQFEFIIPDWRGFGDSCDCPIPQHLNVIESHWQDLDSLLKQLKLPSLVVIAYSMGASTCMHGLQYGKLEQQLKGYLHIDQSPKIPVDAEWPYGLFGRHQPEFKTMLAQMIVLLEQYSQVAEFKQLPKIARDDLMRHWNQFLQLQSRGHWLPKVFKLACQNTLLQGHLLPTQRLDYLKWYLQNYLDHREDYRQALSQLKCPVSFFMGVHSLLYPIQGQELVANSISHAKRVYFEKSGHALMLMEPAKFSREIGQFLKQFRA